MQNVIMQPIEVGGQTFKNRIMFPPLTTCLLYTSGLVQVKHHNGQTVVTAECCGGGVHNSQALVQHTGKGQGDVYKRQGLRPSAAIRPP